MGQDKRAKRVLITGVSRGLGRAMAEEFIAQGHQVIGCARSESAIAQLQEAYGRPHDFVAVDLLDKPGILRWSQTILEEFGAPDLVLNNAGIVHPLAPLWTIDGETFDRVIDINIKSVANMVRCWVPAMVEQSRGVIVNFSAGWGRYTAAKAAPYCASKWAIEGLTGALAQELPPGMAAVTLWPGTIHTQALELVYGEERASGHITPQQWAKLAVPFLLHIGPSDNGKPLSIPTG